MKTMKKTLSLVLALVMVMAVLIVPTSANTDAFYYFPLVTKSMGSGYMAAAVAIQKFLMLYSSSFYVRIYNSGGTDGFFGETSASVTSDYQAGNGLSADGKVGSLTWMKIGSQLTEKSGSDSGGVIYSATDRSGYNISNCNVIIYGGTYQAVDLYGKPTVAFYPL